jgi:hypothetical protein
MPGARDEGVESRTEGADELCIGWPAHQSVGFVPALSGELADEIPDVGPDAVVVQLARVDNDAQWDLRGRF